MAQKQKSCLQGSGWGDAGAGSSWCPSSGGWAQVVKSVRKLFWWAAGGPAHCSLLTLTTRAGFGTRGRAIHRAKHRFCAASWVGGHPRSSSDGRHSSRCCARAVSPPAAGAAQTLRSRAWALGISRCPAEERVGGYSPSEGGAFLLCCLCCCLVLPSVLSG